MIKEQIIRLIKDSIVSLQKADKLPDFGIPEIKLEHPREKTHGDYATSISLEIGKITKKDPMKIARLIKKEFRKVAQQPLFEKVEIATPGFINFFLFQKVLTKELKKILEEKEKYGKSKVGKGEKINIEFISANPTGPLTLGNGRGGFCGDVLSNVLEKAGFNVTREYYINDLGRQIKRLGYSVIGTEEHYKGDYIKKLREEIKPTEKEDPDQIGQKAAKIILEKMIKPTVEKMGIEFDRWFSEKSLHQKEEVKNVLSYILKRKNLVYEKDGALWFHSTKFGDDKDRVVERSNEEPTYFLSDIAYLRNKFERGAKKLILFLGADHAGYVKRLKAATKALGYKKEQLKIIIMQLVHLFEGKKKIKMSKRAGTFVTLDELIDEVGVDVARFFFLSRKPGSHLNFDLDLAKKESEENPVYYIKYAHARICSILRKNKVKMKKEDADFGVLEKEPEFDLIKQLLLFPEIIEDTAQDYQVQRIPQYSLDLATIFHKFYEKCQVLTENKKLTQARLSLVLASKIILADSLNLMGICAPEKM